MYTITATAPPVNSQGSTLRDMALRSHCCGRCGTWPEPAPEQEPADHDTSREENRLAESRGNAFAGPMCDVTDCVRDLADDIGEPIGQRLGDIPGDIELRGNLVDQVECLGQLEAF